MKGIYLEEGYSIEEGKSGGMFSSKVVIGFSSLWVIPEEDQTFNLVI